MPWERKIAYPTSICKKGIKLKGINYTGLSVKIQNRPIHLMFVNIQVAYTNVHISLLWEEFPTYKKIQNPLWKNISEAQPYVAKTLKLWKTQCNELPSSNQIYTVGSQ